MASIESKVIEMNDAFGTEVGTREATDLGIRLINEEKEEVCDAYAEYLHDCDVGSHVELAKDHLLEELADLIIVAYGMAYNLGSPLDDIAECKMAENMKKIMTMEEAEQQIELWCNKGIACVTESVDGERWVVKSSRNQWLAHKHYPLNKVMKRL